jgi:thiol-disulfide isomerase/thioredoxin
MTINEILPRTLRAHELYGDFWFNSEPVPISALHGRVIVIHFWDYTCVHCLRSLPYIKEWNKKYAPYGLVVVGVHAPKFPFGKNPENVQKAINQLGIEYPVVTDNEYLISTHYGNMYWPATYLIDRDGYVRYQNIGERNYTSTEHAIQTLLRDAGVREEMPELMEPVRDADKPGAVCYRVTPDLFAGYSKGSIGNVEGYSPESLVHYDDPKLYMPGRFYAVGNWMNDKNCLRLNEEEGREGEIVLTYQALEVNAIIKPEGEKDFEVIVKQDDRFLTDDIKGEDVQIAPDGKSLLLITEARMHSLVKNKEYGEHTLRLSTRSGGFALYSFTFVSCVIPELISNN